MRQVLFLQNAWSPVYAGGIWPRPSWLRALEASRSGTRLRIMIDDYDICENTTPQVGAHPDSVLPPDRGHIASVLVRRKPEIVIACGKQAELALTEIWPGPLLIVPHPAHRVLTDALYVKARRLLELKDTLPPSVTNHLKLNCGRMALRQGRGRIIEEVFGLLTCHVDHQR